jgi:hypothetical protein
MAGLVHGGGGPPGPEGFGIYLARDDWQTGGDADLQLLFDDPGFVDAEPVAVYRRGLQASGPPVPAHGDARPVGPPSQGGRLYHGPVGQALNSTLFISPHEDMPGVETDAGQKPIFAAPPQDSIRELRVYVSHRDRFDDPEQARIAGGWELLMRLPVQQSSSFDTSLPAGTPAVLAGFGGDGRVMRWTTGPHDSQGRQATFYAFAGDHYSGVRPGMFHFCLGCHPGHSHLGSHNHAEQR